MRCTMCAPPSNAQGSFSVSIWNVREMTDEEGDWANTSCIWLGETFRVWMGTADPGGQIFRHICFVSSENLCKVRRKNHNENPRKKKPKTSRCRIKHLVECPFFPQIQGGNPSGVNTAPVVWSPVSLFYDRVKLKIVFSSPDWLFCDIAARSFREKLNQPKLYLIVVYSLGTEQYTCHTWHEFTLTWLELNASCNVYG